MAGNFSNVLLNFICLGENVASFVSLKMEFLYGITFYVKLASRGSETIQAITQ